MPTYQNYQTYVNSSINKDTDFINDNNVFSATDIVAYITLPGKKAHILGTLSMISISSHSDGFPVTTLGRRKAKGFTRGHTMFGGTLVFASFDRSVWHKIIEATRKDSNDNKYLKPISKMRADELPPFDISITMVNEHGTVAYTGIIGAIILDFGTVYSLENLSNMETYAFMFLDLIPLQPFLEPSQYHLDIESELLGVPNLQIPQKIS